MSAFPSVTEDCDSVAKRFKKSRFGKVLRVPGARGAGTGYPHAKLVEFFTQERVNAIVNCNCNSCPGSNPSLDRPFKDDLVSKIRNKDNSYVSVLAFLLLHSECRFITSFIDKGYSDRELASHHILKEYELNELLELETDCNNADYITFFQFFIPVLWYKDRHNAQPRTIHELQVLPFHTIRKIGGGGYSNVFEAIMLERYHDFEEVKDGRIAVKVYSHTEDGICDCEKEMCNNVRYNHPKIMPLQYAIFYRETYMHIYPLATCCLKTLLQKDVPRDWTPEFVWNEFAELLSALNHIHGPEDGYGYHFDLKPANILLYRGNLAITDLGVAHHKVTNELDRTSTSRKSGSDEYGAPELLVSRSFDIWAMATIGTELLMWLKRGSAGVADFHEKRKHSVTKCGEPTEIVSNFHCGEEVDDLQPAVKDVLSKAENDGGLSAGVVKILRSMLSHDPHKRPTALQAENLFRELLSQFGQTVRFGQPALGMPPPNSVTESTRTKIHASSPTGAMSRRLSAASLAVPGHLLKRPRSKTGLVSGETVLAPAPGAFSTQNVMQVPEIRISNGENREAKKQRNINVTLNGAGSM